MSRTVSLVQRVFIASPCPVSWNSMAGDDRSRFCSHCNLNVYNLSAMTEHEANELLREKEGGRICGAFYRRADGTILTQDCPKGMAAVRRHIVRLAACVAAAFFFASASAAFVIGQNRARTQPPKSAYRQTMKSMERWLHVRHAVIPVSMPVPGQLSFRPPPPSSSPTTTVQEGDVRLDLEAIRRSTSPDSAD